MENSVYTVTADCQDCYRCVRACPVKAIRVHRGQAGIEDSRCITCGTCVRECPQHAKTIHETTEEVRALISSGANVVASVAPSFAAFFGGWRASRIPAALRRLGFKYVSETAEGAYIVTKNAFSGSFGGSICTACPAVVNYIEKYRPEYLEYMMPITSPMIAHGRFLKEKIPGCRVVFIGPCAAKKTEARREENAGVIDAVITFNELLKWFSEEQVDLATCPESGFEAHGEIGQARMFPLQGGMLKTGDITCDGTNPTIIHVSGAENIINLFNTPPDEFNFDIVEPLFCAGGCINGPGIDHDMNIFEKRKNLVEYALDALPQNKELESEIPCNTSFSRAETQQTETDEDKINRVLELTGKSNPKLQLNCGACGYKTCIDNARAVIAGMAEPEMCMPYMRRLAQQRTDRIIETTPNGVVILDSELHILHMNPSFQRMFTCGNGILGRRISYLVDAEGFEKMLSGTTDSYEGIRSKYGIRYHELLYALREENQYVGIYSDISRIGLDEKQLDILKNQMLDQSRELLDHQIKFSQQMAHYLGKSTAQSEELVKRLMSVYEE